MDNIASRQRNHRNTRVNVPARSHLTNEYQPMYTMYASHSIGKRYLSHIKRFNQASNGLEYCLPFLPVVEQVVIETTDRENALQTYQAIKGIIISNKIHEPWPTVDEYTL